MNEFDIPQRLPMVTMDRCVDALACTGEMIIQAELHFQDSLDADRLCRALCLVLDAEPVLGCRFVSHAWAPWWERVEVEPEELLTVTDDPEEFDGFYHRPLALEKGPRIRAFLLSPPGTRLLVQLDHRAGDAGGTKDAVACLGQIYTELGRDPSFRPQPNVTGTRGLDQLLREISLKRTPRLALESLRTHKKAFIPRRSHRFLLEKGDPSQPALLLQHLDEKQVRSLAENAKKAGATLNDLFLAAFLRANVRVGRWNGTDQLRYVSTVDLRNWYLSSGKAEGVCNLSCMEFLNLGTYMDNTIEETLSRVVARTRPRKSKGIGLSGFLLAIPFFGVLPFSWLHSFFQWGARWGVSKGNMANTFTNMGPIREDQVFFDRPAEKAWLITPAGYPPLFVFGLTGYKGTLTLSARTFSPGSQRQVLGDYLNAALEELPW